MTIESIKATEDPDALFWRLRVAYLRGAEWRDQNGSMELSDKASYDYADKITSPLSPALSHPVEQEPPAPVSQMTTEQVAAQACAESSRDNGIMGGSAYDCALRAARIARDTPAPVPHLLGRIAELEAELADVRQEIEGARYRKTCVTAPARETCERVAAKLAKTDPEAAGLVEVLPFYIDNAATWRGIAAAMGYEPLAHKEARPVGKWLNERVATFRQKVVDAALASAPEVPDNA